VPKLLAFQIFFTLLFNFSKLTEQHFITLFFVLNFRFLLLLSVLEVSNHLLFGRKLLNFDHLVVDLVLGLTHKFLLFLFMLILHLALLLSRLFRELGEANLVSTNLAVFVINLLLKHASDFTLLVVVLVDLLPSD